MRARFAGAARPATPVRCRTGDACPLTTPLRRALAATASPPNGRRTKRLGSRGRTTAIAGPACSPASSRRWSRSCARSPSASPSTSTCSDAEHERHVRKLLAAAVPPERLRFYRFPTNDAWARDHGAIFVTRPTRDAAAARRRFRLQRLGRQVPAVRPRSARSAGRWPRRSACRAMRKPGVVLEGGSIEVNGEGALLTTEQCLLNPNRNPTLTRADIERLLRDSFGVARDSVARRGHRGRRHRRPHRRPHALRRARRRS